MAAGDYAFLDDLTGADGDLAKGMNATRDLNNTLTNAFAALLPGGMDELNSFDADCNTCRHLKRLPFDRKTRNPSAEGMPGECQKDGRAVVAWGNGQFVGASCWESRKSDRKSVHAPGNPFDGSQYPLDVAAVRERLGLSR